MKHADKSKRTRNLCNAAMLCCAAAVLLTGLGRTLLRPKDVNYYENRPANTVAPLTAESWLDGSFQDAMEAALSDQIPLAQAMKKTFNDAQNKIRYDSMMRLSHRYPNVPVQYDQLLVYGGKYLAYAYCSPDMVIPELTRHSENLNALIAAHPDVTFYLYMVEGDSNNNFPAGENNGAFEYLSSRVNLPAEQMGRFAVDELETYERDFYQTDHHWCNVGSYRGYREAAALREIQSGRKRSHWIWYIFPQVAGLGMSSTSQYYAISGLDEARAYLREPTLRAHLLEISSALLALDESDPTAVFGFPDDLKLRSSMTLFAAAAPDEPVFSAVLDKFFGGQPDTRTLQILGL